MSGLSEPQVKKKTLCKATGCWWMCAKHMDRVSVDGNIETTGKKWALSESCLFTSSRGSFLVCKAPFFFFFSSHALTLSHNLHVNYSVGCLDTHLAALSLSVRGGQFLPRTKITECSDSALTGLWERADNAASALSFMLEFLVLLAC